MTIKLTNDKAAIVDTANKWIPIAKKPPSRGAKGLFINRKLGSARLDVWAGKSDATHWYPLPTWDENEDAGE